MLIITITVDAPSGQAQGIKEDLAMYVEKYGDTRVIDIKEVQPEQMKIETFANGYPS